MASDIPLPPMNSNKDAQGYFAPEQNQNQYPAGPPSYNYNAPYPDGQPPINMAPPGTYNNTYIVGNTPNNQQLTVQPVYLYSRSYLNFTGAIILSCFVYWCCGGFVFGLIAFILAMIGQSRSSVGDTNSARSMLISSYVLSIVGIVFGIAIIIFLIVYFSTVKPKTCYYSHGKYICY